MADGIFKDCFEGSQGVMERLRAVGGNNAPLCSCLYCTLGFFFPSWEIVIVNKLRDCNSRSKCLKSAKLEKRHADEI